MSYGNYGRQEQNAYGQGNYGGDNYGNPYGSQTVRREPLCLVSRRTAYRKAQRRLIGTIFSRELVMLMISR